MAQLNGDTNWTDFFKIKIVVSYRIFRTRFYRGTKFRVCTRGFVQEGEQSIVYDCEARLVTKPACIMLKFVLRGILLGSSLPQTLRVVASSVSLALPKSAGLTHSAAPPFPHKVLRLCGDP